MDLLDFYFSANMKLKFLSTFVYQTDPKIYELNSNFCSQNKEINYGLSLTILLCTQHFNKKGQLDPKQTRA